MNNEVRAKIAVLNLWTTLAPDGHTAYLPGIHVSLTVCQESSPDSVSSLM
jgi:hypothetical protein